jgi:AraC-like DNA-binding protein
MGEPIACFELDTDHESEAIRVQRARELPGVEFWTITETRRAWSMIHDAFAAWFVRSEPGMRVGRWSRRGREHDVVGGSVHLFEPGESHHGATFERPTKLSIIWWSPAAVESSVAELGIREPLRWNRHEVPAYAVPEAMPHLWELLDGDGANIADACAELTRELVLTARETAPHETHDRCHPGVERALAHLARRFAENVPLDELAGVARLSKYHLARRFRDATGFAPHRYQTMHRVLEARRCLERGASVEDAAEIAGFVDASHLTRVFRRALGVTPGAWGRAYRASDPSSTSLRTLPPVEALTPSGERCPAPRRRSRRAALRA